MPAEGPKVGVYGVQVFSCLGVLVGLRVSGFGLMTFGKVRGAQNGHNSTWGKTGHLQEGGPKIAKMFGWGKFSTFWASSSAKQLRKFGRFNISGRVKHGHL